VKKAAKIAFGACLALAALPERSQSLASGWARKRILKYALELSSRDELRLGRNIVESERSFSTRLDTDLTSSCAFCAWGPVSSGARNSIPWQAAKSSIASTLRRFSSMEESRPAAPIPMDT
jgi:hypothetical protein